MTITSLSKRVVACRKERRLVAEADDGIVIWTDQPHNPSMIEASLMQTLQDAYEDDFTSVVVVHCSKNCQHEEGIHVYVELSPTASLMNFIDVSYVLRHNLMKNHNAFCPCILYFEAASFDQYRLPSRSVQRFQLQDDIILKKLHNKILQASLGHYSEWQPDLTHVEACHQCFKQVVQKPLSWKNFNILQEWHLDVPLDVQILLESFINSSSMRKSKDAPKMMENKMSMLYTTYDRLLNILNRTHVGVLQLRNTEELAMHYQSVNTVFVITSNTGTSVSLREAERSLK